ncbi:MAG TPA: DUF58 domain-containing protein [Streptosporangiaceae bacterium]|jgi:uncharacterized protein (DUF58 family)|nr:DUF58 domain-containing protein [Streptosporangiaceae bacterium]
MRALFGSLTTRGRSFLAAGGAAVICGLAIPEPDLVRVGALLIVLPLVSAMTARRARYRLSCSRRLDPPRVPAGQPAVVTARLANDSRLRTSVLLAEDAIPYPLGGRPRFVLEEIEPGGVRELSYPIRSGTRGKFTLGPLRVRVADAFGLVEITRSFRTTSTLVVTPTIYPLPRAAAASSWLGDGDGGMRTISATGEDDAAPRAYRDGDSLHRVHWKSTARYGELMVRREEHQWRNSASVFLDTRRSAHAGSGPASTFELAVSAAASIGVHLTEEGFRARLITEAGEIAPSGTFADTLLDMLAVITPSRDLSLTAGLTALAAAGGQLIAVLGRLSPDDARRLAASRRGSQPAMALLLAVSSWRAGGAAADGERAAEILSGSGWRVAVVTAATSLAAAWQRLHRPAAGPVPAGRSGGGLP